MAISVYDFADTTDALKISLGSTLDSKRASVFVEEEEKVHCAWLIDENTVFSVEYIPGNYPSLIASVDTLEDYVDNIIDVEWIMKEFSSFDKEIKKAIFDRIYTVGETITYKGKEYIISAIDYEKLNCSLCENNNCIQVCFDELISEYISQL